MHLQVQFSFRSVFIKAYHFLSSCILIIYPSLFCRSSGKNDTSKGSSDQNLSKIVEDLIARAKKLEDELLRYKHDKNYHQTPFLKHVLDDLK